MQQPTLTPNATAMVGVCDSFENWLLKNSSSLRLPYTNNYKIQTCETFENSQKNLYRSTPTPNATAASAVVLHGASFAATTTRFRTFKKKEKYTCQ